METNPQQLTAREQSYFDHVRQAKEQGVTLKAYCQKLGVNVRSLYGVRRDLVEKGVLPRTLPPKTAKTKKARPAKFVAVRVLAPGSNNGSEAVCRVRHPSGWVIECGRWPEAAWVWELTRGAGDASA